MTNLDISLQFYDNLKRFILTKVSNPEDANDILQDSLLKAQSNIHLLKESTKFTSWLYQIIRNSIIDYYRVRKVTLNIDETNIEDQFEYVEENDNNVLAKCLKMLLKQLPDKYREALELSELSDMSQSELSFSSSFSYKVRNKIKNTTS